MPEGNVLILLSGGIDSTACLHFFKDQSAEIECIFVNYGQVALQMERRAIKNISEYYRVPVHEIEISCGLDSLNGEYVGRNALFLTLAFTQFHHRSGLIGIGIHAGTEYDDCTPAFIAAVQSLLDKHNSKTVTISAPFIKWTKNEIWDYCKQNNVPLDLTYSCELGLQQPCDKCDTCKDLKILYASEI